MTLKRLVIAGTDITSVNNFLHYRIISHFFRNVTNAGQHMHGPIMGGKPAAMQVGGMVGPRYGYL
jgi:hypothetical protein